MVYKDQLEQNKNKPRKIKIKKKSSNKPKITVPVIKLRP